jgi:hypothetical protein
MNLRWLELNCVRLGRKLKPAFAIFLLVGTPTCPAGRQAAGKLRRAGVSFSQFFIPVALNETLKYLALTE